MTAETATEPAETNAAGLTDATGTEDTPETAPEASEAPSPNREAAKYRRQLRDVEAERDALADTVKTLRTAAAEAVLSDILAKPSALWLAGHDVAEFYGEDGALDVDALREAAQAAVKDLGIAGYKRFQGSADSGARGNSGTAPTPTWADVFSNPGK